MGDRSLGDTPSTLTFHWIPTPRSRQTLLHRRGNGCTCRRGRWFQRSLLFSSATRASVTLRNCPKSVAHAHDHHEFGRLTRGRSRNILTVPRAYAASMLNSWTRIHRRVRSESNTRFVFCVAATLARPVATPSRRHLESTRPHRRPIAALSLFWVAVASVGAQVYYRKFENRWMIEGKLKNGRKKVVRNQEPNQD